MLWQIVLAVLAVAVLTLLEGGDVVVETKPSDSGTVVTLRKPTPLSNWINWAVTTLTPRLSWISTAAPASDRSHRQPQPAEPPKELVDQLFQLLELKLQEAPHLLELMRKQEEQRLLKSLAVELVAKELAEKQAFIKDAQERAVRELEEKQANLTRELQQTLQAEEVLRRSVRP